MCAALFGLMAVCSTMVLPPGGGAAPARRWRSHAGSKRRAIQKEVHVAVRRGLDSREALDRAERADDFLRDDARRLAQPARQLEASGTARSPSARRGGDFDRNGGEHRIVGGNVVEAADGVGHAACGRVMDR